MKKTHPLKILLRSFHDSSFTPLKDFLIYITHRGVENDEKIIGGEDVARVDRTGIYLNDETFIPAHRIKRAVLKSDAHEKRF